MKKKYQIDEKNIKHGTATNPDYKKPEKIYYHIFGLQCVNPDRFAKVVNKILKREYILIK